jgi:hypothetical protein
VRAKLGNPGVDAAAEFTVEKGSFHVPSADERG